MFYTDREKSRLEDKIRRLEEFMFKLGERIDGLEAASNALLNSAIYKAKLESRAPHGMRKDGTPRIKPGPKGPRKVTK